MQPSVHCTYAVTMCTQCVVLENENKKKKKLMINEKKQGLGIIYFAVVLWKRGNKCAVKVIFARIYVSVFDTNTLQGQNQEL